MQPDGTLNPSADPKELPDPSDSDASYWLARTIWALGEGYAAFHGSTPATRRSRPSCATGSTSRSPRSTGRCSTATAPTCRSTARRTPAWLIVDGADATRRGRARPGGLRPGRRHRRGPHDALRAAQRRHRRAVRRRRPDLAVRRACCPGRCRARDWHAWALADAGRPGPRLRRRSATRRWPRRRSRDSFTFDPWLLTSGGPDNGRLPDPDRRARRSPTAPTRACSRCSRPPTRRGSAGAPARRHRGGLVLRRQRLRRSRRTTRPPAHLRRHRRPTARVNHNSGAESTIHGLLTMLALDAHPTSPRSPHRARSREPGRHRRRCRPRTRTLSGGAQRRQPRVDVDRRVAVRRHRLRRPAATAAPRRSLLGSGEPRLAADAGGRPAARQHRGHHVHAPAHRARHASSPATSARRATRRRPARCCPVTLPATLPAGSPYGDRDDRRPAATRPGWTR